MVLTNISEVRELVTRHGFSFNKSLGQNFLINPSVCPRMTDGVTGGVLEIGAGIGVLTRELAKKADKVAVIEIDERLKPILAETLSDCPNVEIIWGDALKLNLMEIITSRFGGEKITVCANLPYYAATHIIMTLLEQRRLPIKTITAMVQEEVAERFTATPNGKQYGLVSVAARYYSAPKLLFKVSRGSFIPSPNVGSAVIRLDVFEENGKITDEKRFFELVRASFSERRKQLCNPVSRLLGIDKDFVKSALSGIGLNPDARGESLGLEKFMELYGKLFNENSRD